MWRQCHTAGGAEPRARSFANGFRPNRCTGRYLKPGLCPKEALNLLIILLKKDRAGDVDESPAGFDETGCLLKQSGLLGDARGELVAGEPPFCVRPAPP